MPSYGKILSIYYTGSHTVASSVYDRSGSGLGLTNFLMLQAYEQGNKKENERCTPEYRSVAKFHSQGSREYRPGYVAPQGQTGGNAKYGSLLFFRNGQGNNGVGNGIIMPMNIPVNALKKPSPHTLGIIY